MKKTTKLFYAVMQWASKPRTIMMSVALIPFALSFFMPDACDIGGNGGGCTGG